MKPEQRVPINHPVSLYGIRKTAQDALMSSPVVGSSSHMWSTEFRASGVCSAAMNGEWRVAAGFWLERARRCIAARRIREWCEEPR